MLPKNFIVMPRAGFRMTMAQRYCSPFSLVHVKQKSRQDPAAQYHSTVHEMEKSEEDVGVFRVFSWTAPGLLIDEKAAHC
jgi:hypothetical protein